jgi:hypothetical protein
MFGRLFSATSQWFNVLLLNGQPNESISGRCYRESWITSMMIINKIFFWQNHHCRGAYMKDIEWAKAYLADYKDHNG